MSEKALRHQPDLQEFAHSELMSFLLWLLMVDLNIEADDKTQYALEQYATEPDASLVYSIAPHTGHPDSLYVYKAIETLAPQSIPQLQFVSAKDTWSTKMSQMIAKAVAGEPYLFDRDNLNGASLKAQIGEMSGILAAEQPEERRSLAIYPQGTRTPGAPIEHMPVSLALQAHVPIAVLNIHGAEYVMPKVPEGTQTRQIIKILIQRMYTWKSRHHVRVELADFIPADLSRKAMKERFMAAHQKSAK